MSEHPEPNTAATKLLSRALFVWARGYQVIPLPDPASGRPVGPSESTWLTKRQEREDVERLFGILPQPQGVGIIQVSSLWSPFIVGADWPAVKKLLAEDISRVQVQTDEASVEWLLTSKFEFFEQLEKLRATREAARREAQAAEEKLKLPGLPVTRVGEGDLNNLFSNPTVIRKVARILGIPESQTERGGFLCVLHKEQHPSAHLFQDNRGRFIYTCFHRSGRRVRPLPEVYYVQKTDNTDEQLKGPTFAVWALRLLAEAGVLQPLDDVGFPPLEGNVTDGLRKVYDGLRLLFSLRWTYSAGEAAPVSWRFAAEWCGVSQATAGKAMHELLRLGVIHAAGKHKNITLFLPGRGKRVVRIRFVGRKSEHAGRHSAE